MKIEYWSDFACPFCYLGSRILKNALEKTGIDATVTLRSFELDPHAPINACEDMLEHVMGLGMSQEEAWDQLTGITELGSQIGLEFKMLKAKVVNTLDAHRLVHHAQKTATAQTATKLIDRLYEAYFSRGESVADQETLLRIAKEVGLEADASVFGLYEAEVRADELQAQQMGLEYIPYFLVDGKHVLQGAVSEEEMVAFLKGAKG